MDLEGDHGAKRGPGSPCPQDSAPTISRTRCPRLACPCGIENKGKKELRQPFSHCVKCAPAAASTSAATLVRERTAKAWPCKLGTCRSRTSRRTRTPPSAWSSRSVEMLHAIQKKAKADHLPGFEPARRAPAASESVTVKKLKILNDEKKLERQHWQPGRERGEVARAHAIAIGVLSRGGTTGRTGRALTSTRRGRCKRRAEGQFQGWPLRKQGERPRLQRRWASKAEVAPDPRRRRKAARPRLPTRSRRGKRRRSCQRAGSGSLPAGIARPCAMLRLRTRTLLPRSRR